MHKNINETYKSLNHLLFTKYFYNVSLNIFTVNSLHFIQYMIYILGLKESYKAYISLHMIDSFQPQYIIGIYVMKWVKKMNENWNKS